VFGFEWSAAVSQTSRSNMNPAAADASRTAALRRLLRLAAAKNIDGGAARLQIHPHK
jgi:hypothetical protein